MNVGSNFLPVRFGLSNLPIYLWVCFFSVVSPSNVDVSVPPCTLIIVAVLVAPVPIAVPVAPVVT